MLNLRAEQEQKRDLWRAYTANAMGAVARSLGWDIPLYTEMNRESEQSAAEDNRSGKEIFEDMMMELGGEEV